MRYFTQWRTPEQCWEPLVSTHLLPSVKDTSHSNAGSPHLLTNTDNLTHTKAETSKTEANSDTDMVFATSADETVILKSWLRVWETSPPFQCITINLQIFGYWLCPFYNTWALITTDKWALEFIRVGYSIPFPSIPSTQPPAPFLFRDLSHEHLLQQDVHHLLQLGVVEHVPPQYRQKGFYSRYFLTQKKRRS